MQSVLSLSDVSKIYGSGHTAVKAVDNASLQVGQGEVVLIMGPSGSGKTTLLSIAGCLLSPTSGTVQIEDQVVTKLRETVRPQIRLENIGFIFQSFNLLSALTALENVEVVLRLAGVSRRESRQRAVELLNDLGLGNRLNHYPGQLSGGEKQRVAIARALANDPDLILADEPTANLDSRTGHKVVEILNQIAKEKGKSIVIVSHDMRIMDIADRVLQLEDGKLSEAGDFVAEDVVCGMIIQKARAVAKTAYKGEDYYFCSRTCYERFEKNPELYLKKEQQMK